MSEKWEDLGLSNNFIFQKVMLNEELCKKILSEIMGKEIVRIDYSAYEKTIEMRDDAKGIRLDVYIKDQENVVYNVEIQNSNKDSLPKRSRYYHDLIDLDFIEKGEQYETLNNSFVIFICTFDLFGKDYYKYTFTHKCTEVEGLELEDGATTIFMNVGGHLGNISEDCKAFLDSVRGRFTNNEFSAILKKEVIRVKQSKKWRREYMFLSMWLRDELKQAKSEAIQQGIEQGIERGRVEGRGEAEKQINSLHKILLENNQIDDLRKSMEDVEYQRQLMKEYHIN